MQRADAKRRVAVPVRGLLLRCMTAMVCVDVNVTVAVMLVFVRVDIVFQRAFQRPQSDAEQHHADESFAPC